MDEKLLLGLLQSIHQTIVTESSRNLQALEYKEFDHTRAIQNE